MLQVLAFLVVILILLYMLRPYYKPFDISSAEFFETVKGPIISLRFNIVAFVASLPFWAQLFVLLCMIFAIVLSDRDLPRESAESIGILLAIDTSASMSTQDENSTRMDTAKEEMQILRDTIVTLREVYPDAAFCESMIAYDSGGVRVQDSTMLDNLQHRPLGTADTALQLWLEAMLTADTQPESILCEITHVVVISDDVAPEWVTQFDEKMPIIWRDVGVPRDNAGFVSIEPQGSELFGWNGGIEVSVTTYGTPPPSTTITLLDAANNIIDSRDIAWTLATTQSRTFQLPASGEYTLTLTPQDAYAYDNQATIVANNFQSIRFSWELSTPMPFDLSAVGWVEDVTSPNIRIVPASGQLQSGIPTIIVGSAYQQADSIHQITYFDEETGILDRLNLDTAQSLRIGQSSLAEQLPTDMYNIILADDANYVLVATNDNFPFVYIPGPPIINADPELNGFSQTLFFNAARWLLNKGTITFDLYRNTSASNLIPQGNINVLHEGEGAVHLDNVNYGDLSEITPLAPPVTDDPIWALFVFMASLILLLERTLTLFGGQKWN